MKKLTKKQKKIIEDLGWVIHEEYNYLESSSPLGEDLIIQAGQGESLIEAIKSEYENFDIDEHIELWVGMRGQRGVPSSISALVKDAEDIGSMLEELYIALIKEE